MMLIFRTPSPEQQKSVKDSKMAEIDTTSIESVQAAITFFGEKDDHKKLRSICKDAKDMELDKEKEIESLMKELANLKVQMEAKDSAHKQALLKLDHYQKTADELSALLKNSEIEKDALINNGKESRTRVVELESTIEKMSNQLSESTNLREQLSHVLRELKDTQGQLLQLDIELSASKDAKFESTKKVELMETSLSLEKLKTEELQKQVEELNETVVNLKKTAEEEEEEKNASIIEKEMQLKVAEAAASEMHEQLKFVTEQLELVEQLENQLLHKSAYVDKLEKELQKANSLHESSEKVAFDALSELNQLKADFEVKEKQNSDQAACISLLEAEIKKLKLELANVNQEKDMLLRNEEEMGAELEKARIEITEARQKENAAEFDSSHSFEAEKRNSNALVTISKEEYEMLVMKSQESDKVQKPGQETVITESSKLKKELENARTKIAEFRARAEQAISRAEVAERGKAELEEQIKKWKEQKARRKAALAALQEASVSKEIVEASSSKDADIYRYNREARTYQPLSKMLNIKL
ncbi:OLC1v1012383C3 [Oldenlandia corymbosa var. corymbosa]|uniref:OLC1v1012383C3 n=1 Tax=Oldenlandia corymbosa var. corymbosa TaxID=529605 RepID=A0AAV1DVZ9_OLDCO|nr:OLC1v1012383C3 [Oldenlandia corymbosa var. corymbosa]